MKRNSPIGELGIALVFCLGALTFAEISNGGIRTEQRYLGQDIRNKTEGDAAAADVPLRSWEEVKAKWEQQHNQPKLGTLLYRDVFLNLLVGLVLAGPVILSYRAFTGRRSGKAATGENLWMIQGILGSFVVLVSIVSGTELSNQAPALIAFVVVCAFIVSVCFQGAVIVVTFLGLFLVAWKKRRIATGANLIGFMVSFGATLGYLVLSNRWG